MAPSGPGAERLDRLVVRGRDDGKPGRDARRRGRRGGDVPDHLAGQLELEEHARAVSRNCSNSTASLLQSHRVDVDRPLQEDVVGGRVAERAGEAVAEIARGGRRVREGRVVGQVGQVGAVVHPADHRLDERSVCSEERLAAADRAEADGRDLARVAVEALRAPGGSPRRASPRGRRRDGRRRRASAGSSGAAAPGPRRRRALRRRRRRPSCSGCRRRCRSGTGLACRSRPRPSGRGSRRPPTRTCPLT